MVPAAVTSDSTSSASLRTSRAKPLAAENVASPLTGSARQGPDAIAPIRMRLVANQNGPTWQRRAARAQARSRDQNPAAAVRAIVRSSFNDPIGGTPDSRHFPSLELAI